MNSYLLILLGMGALLLRVGLALYCVGVTRAKNSAGAAMRVLCDLCVAVLAYWAVGAAVLYHDPHLAFARDRADQVFFLSVVAAVATGIVPGVVGERSRFLPLLAASALLAGLVVPLGQCWSWSPDRFGWLARLGYTDMAGASWVHVAGGVCAAVAAWLLGPRQGKYHRDGSASVIPGHSLPLAACGVVLLLAGWGPYVMGCVVGSNREGVAVLSVLLAAAAGGVASLAYGHVRYGKPDILLTLLAVMGALVSITAGAGVIATPWAVLTGAVAGLLVPAAAVWIDLILRIDDPAGSVAVHAVGGAWGVLAAGLFAPGGVAERFKHLGVQVLGLVTIALLSGVLSFALFAGLRAVVGLRSKEADEFDGLDLAEHDIAAYPDFQQNTIRSYHLREA